MDQAKSLLQLGSLVEFAGRNAAAEGLYEEGIASALKQAELESLAQGAETAMSQSFVKTAQANMTTPVERYTSPFPVGDKQTALGYKYKVDAAYKASHLPVHGGD